VEKVVVLHRLSGNRPAKKDFEIWWEDAFPADLPKTHPTPAHNSEDPLFILYTSGSTGKPKGVLHTMGGYLTYAAYTHETVFQIRDEDIFWCTADLGWITGHSYLVYGPLANGVTTVMFEGVPTHPNPGRFWEVVDRHRVTIFYTAPTAIRILAAAGDHFVQQASRKSLRILGTVGEPINPEAWKWYDQTVGEGKAPIVDTWWQTETGGILISPIAGITPTKPGSATLPMPGIEPLLLHPSEKTLAKKDSDGTTSGALVLARSWPGQMRGVYGDKNRFHETYFTQYPGYYFTGDGAHCDQDGYFWITGRIDDVIQVAGHRLGTAEIESACVTHPLIAEAGAVGVPDALTGEALHVFVVLKDSAEQNTRPAADPAYRAKLQQEIIATVRKEVGPLATPKGVHLAPGLPKTRSGKIMRRILRKLASGEFNELGDTSTLADPGIVEKIAAALKC
jgi:acetyl-CoA synthetase